MDTTSPDLERRREVFGWMLYAWAVHGFVTTVASVLFSPYQKSHPEPGWPSPFPAEP